MFTDIVGYTAVMGRDEAAGRRVRERNRQVVGSMVERYGGELVDENGDELVLCFASALDAVNCALQLQNDLKDDDELSLRAGIHLGDVVFQGGRVYGDGVNIAARVREHADPGGTCVSAEVWQTVRNHPTVVSTPLGERQLKNVDRPVELYAVSGTALPPESTRRLTRAPRRRLWLPAAAILILLAVLGWWLAGTSPELTPIRSIAVLPLEDLSIDSDQGYFADGMTDALIANLARGSTLKVISRTSVMQYRGTRKPIREIGNELNVDALIEGTVIQDGGRVRVTAQLIDARSDHHLWAEQYDRELEDVLVLQSEIAAAIVNQIHEELTPQLERSLSSSGRRIVPAAHDAYLKGRYFADKHTPSAALRSRTHFEEAMRIDPEYPLGYAGLADALSCSPMHTWVVPAEGSEAVPFAVMNEAHELATSALNLDSDLPESLTALGLASIFRDKDWAEGERLIERAIEINPSFEFAHRARGLVLALQGELDEALRAILTARELDPFSSGVASLAGIIHAWSGDIDTAMELWHEATELDAGHPVGLQQSGLALCRRGRVDEGLDRLERSREISENDPLVIGDIGYCYAVAGRPDEAREILQELEARSTSDWVSPVALAQIRMALDDRDGALDELDRAQRLGSYRILEIGADDRWDPVRDDPRFQTLLRQLGLASG